MSGWDQRYDLNSWAQDEEGKPVKDDFDRILRNLDETGHLYESGRKFQRLNKIMRWMLLGTSGFMLAIAVIFSSFAAWGCGGAFGLLFLINERLINRMKEGGYQ